MSIGQRFQNKQLRMLEQCYKAWEKLYMLGSWVQCARLGFAKTQMYFSVHSLMKTKENFCLTFPSNRMKENSIQSTQKLWGYKNMFLFTLNINEWAVRKYKKKIQGIIETQENVRNTRWNRRLWRSNDDRRATMLAFIKYLPKMPSHCCCSSTSQLYLEPTFQSKVDMWKPNLQYPGTSREHRNLIIICKIYIILTVIKKKK